MNIYIGDEYPGRCKNLRPWTGPGGLIYLRCVDYDKEPHVCSFPDPPAWNVSASSFVNYTTSEPDPWVKPE